MSGFLFAYLQEEKHYRTFGSLIGKKGKRLLVPYIFACVVWVAPLSQYFYHWSGWELTKKYVLGVSPSQLWFLLMLFDVFILAWVTEPIYKKNNWAAVVIAVLGYGAGLAGAHLFPNIYQIWTGFQYLPVFILGYKLWQSERRTNPLIWIILHTGTFIIIQVMPDEELVMMAVRAVISFLNHIFGALMAFTVPEWIAERVDYQRRHWYRVLSKHSMTIYLFHQQIIYFVIWNLNGRVNTVLIAAFNFIISLLLSLLISIILSKFKATRFLIGEKA